MVVTEEVEDGVVVVVVDQWVVLPGQVIGSARTRSVATTTLPGEMNATAASKLNQKGLMMGMMMVPVVDSVVEDGGVVTVEA